MDNENEFNYSSENHFKKAETPKKSGLGKTVFIPFLSGVVGAGLVIGVCFGVPEIKDKVIGKTTTTIPTYSSAPIQEVSIPNTVNSTDIPSYSQISSSVAEKVLPSIVGIEVTYNVNSFWGSSTGKAGGSGIIISEDGYIITNNHVVSAESSSYYEITKATGIKVKLYNDDKEYDATVIGTDAYTDLAVIKINEKGLTAAQLGNSDDIKLGEFAMALGNPVGMNFSVTAGIISGINREVKTTDGTTYIAIQTDAAINSGNSGGALVDSDGKVIGINTLKLSGSGIEGMGFAIPINSTTNVITQLIDHQSVTRPFIGIKGESTDTNAAKIYGLPTGIYVTEVIKDSPAEKAGIQLKDIITKIEGKDVTSVSELNRIKYNYNIGDTVTLTILRNGQEQEIKVTLVEEPEDKEDSSSSSDTTKTPSSEDNSQNNIQIFPDSSSGSIWDFFRN